MIRGPGRKISLAMFVLLIGGSLAACAPSVQELEQMTSIAETAVANSWTLTPSPSPIPTATLTVTPTSTQAPTPTPIPLGGGGGLIAFVSTRNGQDEIFVINTYGQNETQLTDGAGNKRWPSWAPDGNQIAYMLQDDRLTNVFVMNTDGSDPVQLTNGDQDYLPVWAPDGSQIAFFSTRDGYWALFTMNPDGTDQQRLTSNTVFESVVSWSPDSQQMVYTVWPATVYPSDLYVTNQDGTDIRQLTVTEESDRYAAWSPDGERIAFTSIVEHTVQIFTIRPDGSDLVQLTTPPGSSAYVNWSPDGSRIAFSSQRDDPNLDTCADTGGCISSIYVMNADGSNQQRLTDGSIDFEPVWSPDGTTIAFTSNRDGNAEIYLISADGSGLTRLTHNDVADSYPLWQP